MLFKRAGDTEARGAEGAKLGAPRLDADPSDQGGEEGGSGSARAEHVERRRKDPRELQLLRTHQEGRVSGRDFPPNAHRRPLRCMLRKVLT